MVVHGSGGGRGRQVAKPVAKSVAKPKPSVSPSLLKKVDDNRKSLKKVDADDREGGLVEAEVEEEPVEVEVEVLAEGEDPWGYLDKIFRPFHRRHAVNLSDDTMSPLLRKYLNGEMTFEVYRLATRVDMHFRILKLQEGRVKRGLPAVPWYYRDKGSQTSFL